MRAPPAAIRCLTWVYNRIMKTNNFFKLIVAVTVSEMAGVVGGFFTTPAIRSGWYEGLVRPALNPPAWVFGPVWTTLYALMGVAAFLVWRAPANRLEKRLALGLFLVQLFLNTLWSILFFGAHSLGGALIEIVLLWIAIIATIIAFSRVSRLAAWLLSPYILWVTFAAYLNYSFWILNS